MSSSQILEEAKDKMKKATAIFQEQLQGLRTDRTTPAFLDPVTVEVNNSKMKISQVANISLVKTQTLRVQPWDAKILKAIEKGIISANLGVHPTLEGGAINIVMPPLSQERRQEIIKIAHKYGESAKISIRNVRRDALDKVKKLTSSKELTEDDKKNLTQKLQKFTDEFVSGIDTQISKKEKEITG
jgi:ribosome recycling factor